MPLVFATTKDELLSLTRGLYEPLAGGFVSFNGRVRRFNNNREVDHLFYEAHVELALSLFLTLEDRAQKLFGIIGCRAIHRLLRTEVGDDAVVIEVCAPHRNEAFLAARFLIDELKKELPIWKKEVYVDGSSVWGCSH